MADDHVLDPQHEFLGHRLAGKPLGFEDFSFQHADGHHQVADHLAFVGVRQVALVTQLVDLADVVQKRADEQQFRVDLRIVRLDQFDQLHHAHDMFQQAAVIGVVILDAGRCPAELLHEVFVHQVTVGQITQVRVLHGPQHFDHSPSQLVDTLGAQADEIVLVDLSGRHGGDAADNQLQSALIELHGAADLHVVAVLEALVIVLRGVPHQGRHLPRAIAQIDLQVKISVAVRAKLLVRGQIDFTNRLLWVQLPKKLTRHRELSMQRAGVASVAREKRESIDSRGLGEEGQGAREVGHALHDAFDVTTPIHVGHGFGGDTLTSACGACPTPDEAVVRPSLRRLRAG